MRRLGHSVSMLGLRKRIDRLDGNSDLAGHISRLTNAELWELMALQMPDPTAFMALSEDARLEMARLVCKSLEGSS